MDFSIKGALKKITDNSVVDVHKRVIKGGVKNVVNSHKRMADGFDDVKKGYGEFAKRVQNWNKSEYDRRTGK